MKVDIYDGIGRWHCTECGHTHTGRQLGYICIGCACDFVPDHPTVDAFPVNAGDDRAWYAARRKLLRGGQALTKAEHDALTDGLGRALTDSPIRLRPGRDLIADATPTTTTKGN